MRLSGIFGCEQGANKCTHPVRTGVRTWKRSNHAAFANFQVRTRCVQCEQVFAVVFAPSSPRHAWVSRAAGVRTANTLGNSWLEKHRGAQCPQCRRAPEGPKQGGTPSTRSATTGYSLPHRAVAIACARTEAITGANLRRTSASARLRYSRHLFTGSTSPKRISSFRCEGCPFFAGIRCQTPFASPDLLLTGPMKTSGRALSRASTLRGNWPFLSRRMFLGLSSARPGSTWSQPSS